MTTPPEELRYALIRAFCDGLAHLDPSRLVERALSTGRAATSVLSTGHLSGRAPSGDPEPRTSPGTTSERTQAGPRGRIAVIAAGKASLAMARGAVRALGDRIDAGLVVTADPRPQESNPTTCPSHIGAVASLGPISFIRAAHPVPDARSVAAANAALALATELGRGDLLLALISGGASALLAAPPPGIALEGKQALVAALLEAGAPIQQVNLVRRHMSRVKGGRLAHAANGARVLTLYMSDVVRGLAHDIGSGPTVPDPTRAEDAVVALQRWAPQHMALAPALTESLKPTGALENEAWLLADPTMLAEHIAAALASASGLRVTVAPPEEGEARAMAARRAALASSLMPGEAVVIPCEPTIVLPARRGEGGRAGWVALATARALPTGTALLCAASDGVDGSSGAAGAAVTCEAVAAIPPGIIEEALAGFDDAAVHRVLGTHIEGGPTGHNLTDVHIVARAR